MKILHNSALKWSTNLAYNDLRGTDTDVSVGVTEGDALYFLVDANGENSSDGTKWDPVITYGVSNVASQQFSS
ncbi:hypothetical protein, partial [Paenibacillus periandrae]|uniref:hypothetical protein n=1 Tax=Paenibacillus periandrae TaxID=1761741 RepID=UPI001F08F70F